MGKDVAEFMAQNAGEFVLIAGHGDKLARDVNAATGQAERIGDRQIRKEKLNTQIRGRRVVQQTFCPTRCRYPV